MKKNIILNTDSYKTSMFCQYPPGTREVFSYIESRGGRFNETVFFGLQGFIMDYLLEPITREDIDEAEEILSLHGVPFYREGWEYILKEKGGFLPISIAAVPEGTVVPILNPMVTVRNTDPNCFWLVSYIETALLRAIWFPSTVATQSKEIRKIINYFLEKNGNPDLIDFKLHDFGARGVSSEESAMIGGAAHLLNFKGTDTISSLRWLRKNYEAEMAGFSIPAMEHSTVTSWGKNNEVDAYKNMLNQYAKPGSILAAVSDSYDIFNAVENLWGEDLRKHVVDSGATIVIRPDSGDPVKVCQQVVEILGEKFGYSMNEKNYRVLNNVRVIQGDGVCLESISDILNSLDSSGWSADNIAFGMGGALLQKINRDTQKFAQKVSAVKLNGVWQGVSKNPVTDPGKKSKEGLVNLFSSENCIPGEVFNNGILLRKQTLDEIRSIIVN